MGYHAVKLVANVMGVERASLVEKVVNWPFVPAAGLVVVRPFGEPGPDFSEEFKTGFRMAHRYLRQYVPI